MNERRFFAKVLGKFFKLDEYFAEMLYWWKSGKARKGWKLRVIIGHTESHKIFCVAKFCVCSHIHLGPSNCSLIFTPQVCANCKHRRRTASQCEGFSPVFSHSKYHSCFHYPLAGKQFKSVSLRNLHERRERGEKRFSCSFCQKKFANGQQKRNHERTHTGEKPYDCEHCGRMFAQKHQVNSGRKESIYPDNCTVLGVGVPLVLKTRKMVNFTWKYFVWPL